MKLGVILGDQLFAEKIKADHYFMAETLDLANHFKYHKHKITFFFACMRNYAQTIKNITYLKLEDKKSFIEKLQAFCKTKKVTEISMYEIEDKFFQEQMIRFGEINKIQIEFKQSPGFLTTRDEFSNFLNGRKKVLFNEFYIWQRKRLNILIEKGLPEGGKWSFDSENRKKLPKNINIPVLKLFQENENLKKVKELVESKFKSNPGSTSNFYLPTTRKQAQMWLDHFLTNKFKEFGPYEDAISQDESFIFHSILSPLLNIGLLTPDEIVKKALVTKSPINSKEGFVRQIIGWREFIRGVYHNWDFNKNYFKHTNKLTKSWYEGTTGIKPLDDSIKKVNKFAYTHHIERLMIIGNIMLLCQIDPEEVNKWFMELYFDSANWVMVPNVYGMSQFADGGSFATKPYICGSNYILKMSDYKKDDWCEVMDGLYWRFISKNKKLFQTNARMPFVVKNLEKMDESKRKRIFKKAEEFIKRNTK